MMDGKYYLPNIMYNHSALHKLQLFCLHFEYKQAAEPARGTDHTG